MVNYESFISWEGDKPVVKYKKMLSKNNIADLPVASLSMPYKRTDEEIILNIDPEFGGKTNAEVMNIRLARKAADGNMEAIKTLQDRILGKPMQQITSLKITETYTEYLERATKAEEEFQEAKVNVL